MLSFTDSDLPDTDNIILYRSKIPLRLIKIRRAELKNAEQIDRIIIITISVLIYVFVLCVFFILHVCHIIVTRWGGPDGIEA